MAGSMMRNVTRCAMSFANDSEWGRVVARHRAAIAAPTRAAVRTARTASEVRRVGAAGTVDLARADLLKVAALQVRGLTARRPEIAVRSRTVWMIVGRAGWVRHAVGGAVRGSAIWKPCLSGLT